MKHHFRIPTWYRYTVLVIYTLAGTVLLNESFYLLHPVNLFVVFFLFGIGGLWIIHMWNKRIIVDLSTQKIIIGKTVFKIEDIIEYRIGIFSSYFRIKDKTIVFPYPVEDPDVLGRYLRGDYDEPF